MPAGYKDLSRSQFLVELQALSFILQNWFNKLKLHTWEDSWSYFMEWIQPYLMSFKLKPTWTCMFVDSN